MATVTERKTGHLMRWTVKDPSTGRLIKQSRMYCGAGGKRAALAEANRIEAQAREKLPGTAPKTMTFAAFVNDRWMPFIESTTAPVTARGNRQRIDKALAELGGTPLREISGMAIDRSIGGMKQGGMSPLMARHVFDAVRTCLRQASKWKLISGQSWLDATRPSVPRKRAKVASLEESFRLAEAFRKAGRPVAAAFVETIADSGARPGEVLALMWDSVNLDDGTIRIWRALERMTSAKYRIKETPKNEGSVRTVVLSASTVTTLRSLKTWHLEMHLKSGGCWPKDGLLFPGMDGGLWAVHSAAAMINRQAKKIGVTSGSYSRRHGMASEMIGAGVPVSVVSARMGHSDFTTTLKTYTHVLPGQADAAVAFLNARNKT